MGSSETVDENRPPRFQTFVDEVQEWSQEVGSVVCERSWSRGEGERGWVEGRAKGYCHSHLLTF
jgi:hypothetical protein